MSQSPILMYCPNPLCQTGNERGKLCCDRCDTAIPHRYLWLTDSRPLENKQRGDLISDRYCWIDHQIVLDTKPNDPPIFPDKIDDVLVRYAELFPFRTNVPQVYGFLEDQGNRYALLENSAVYPEHIFDASGHSLTGQLMPRLVDRWRTAFEIQRYSWIRQLAVLWQSLGRLGITQSILNPNLIRVDGDMVRLLYLEEDQIINPSLANFAEIFLTEVTDMPAESFWHQLFSKMIQQDIIDSDRLLAVLDQELAMIQKISGSPDFTTSIATLTHRGPTRSKNEDACYPASETRISSPFTSLPLLVVCDGIGGHEGGSFASNSAITTITSGWQELETELTGASSETIIAKLQMLVAKANDAICDRNDLEKRHERQRMGTTIVLAYIQGCELYLTHIGDSRAYRISSTGCYQTTVDDDLASRETILGSTFYREALQYPGTGSLTQALGMNPSDHLQLTTQKFVLDEDCVFLLCSDGLSDFDRVDACWQAEILPVLQRRQDLYSACERLVEVANTRNGHDNVTIGLLHFHQNVKRPEVNIPRSASSKSTLTAPTLVALGSKNAEPQSVQTTAHTADRPSSGFLKLALGLFGLGCIAGGALWWRYNGSSLPGLPSASPPISLNPTSSTSGLTIWDVGRVFRVETVAPLLSEPLLVPTIAPSPTPSLTPSDPLTIVPGTIVQVAGQLSKSPQENWIKLKVCTVPTAAASLTAPTGITGWQTVEKLTPLLAPVNSLPPEQLGDCATQLPVSSPDSMEKR
jgi:protein phosphatase